MSEELAVISEIRQKLHDALNVVTKLDSINRKMKKDLTINEEFRNQLDSVVQELKIDISFFRDKVYQLENKLNKK